MTSYIFPHPPQNVHCTKCNKDVVVAVNPGKPDIESECTNSECPIAHDPNHQSSGSDGIRSFTSEEEFETWFDAIAC